MLDRVRDIDRVPIDACLTQSLMEYLASGADEGLPFDVLAISWLLTDEHRAGTGSTGTEYRLGRVAEQVTGLAACGGAYEFGESQLTRSQCESILCREPLSGLFGSDGNRRYTDVT